MEFRPTRFSRGAFTAIVAGMLIATASPALAEEITAPSVDGDEVIVQDAVESDNAAEKAEESEVQAEQPSTAYTVVEQTTNDTTYVVDNSLKNDTEGIATEDGTAATQDATEEAVPEEDSTEVVDDAAEPAADDLAQADADVAVSAEVAAVTVATAEPEVQEVAPEATVSETVLEHWGPAVPEGVGFQGETSGWSGNRYYDADGSMARGERYLQAEEGHEAGWYYFLSDGTAANGELYRSDDSAHTGWYYFDNGRMVHGFWTLSDGRKVYYDANNGIMHHGESLVSDASGNGWRHFDEVYGTMTTLWKRFEYGGGKWVYYDPTNGVMAHGEAYATGSGGDGWCYFDDVTGATQYGWKNVSSNGGKWVYYDTATGRMHYGEDYLYSNNANTGDRHWYWFNPVTGATSYGFQDITTPSGVKKRAYYSQGWGWMQYGWQTIEGKRYHLDNTTGAVTFKWQQIDGATYYGDDTDGHIVTGEYEAPTAASGHAAGWYHFNDTNATLDLGWKYLTAQHKWVYYDPATGGAMTHSNFTQDGVTYIVDASTGAISNATVNRVHAAMQWMCDIANDPSHGYDQDYRWGERGDYDCSSLVISAFKQAGFDTGSASYTGNMRSNFTAHGFVWITDLSSRQTGDILLNEYHHTALYLGNNWLVHASANENRAATGGKPGDQTGKEIYERSYYNYPWNGILRFVG